MVIPENIMAPRPAALYMYHHLHRRTAGEYAIKTVRMRVRSDTQLPCHSHQNFCGV